MASVDPFVEGAPPVSPAQAAGWTKYRMKTREAVAADRYREGYQRAIGEDRYREGMARFWGVSPERVRAEVMQAWQGAQEGASTRWNDEFNQHPDRVRNADKWLQAARAGIQR